MSKEVSLSRIRQIALPVDSVEKAKRFYGDVLGMRHLFDAPPALSFFDCGGVRLMLAGPAAQGEDGGRRVPGCPGGDAMGRPGGGGRKVGKRRFKRIVP